MPTKAKMSKQDFISLFPNPSDYLHDTRRGLTNGATRKGHVHIHKPASKPSKGKVSCAEHRRVSKAYNKIQKKQKRLYARGIIK